MDFSSFFSKTFLFSNMPCEQIKELLGTSVKKMRFSRMESVNCSESFSDMLGFVFRGECEDGSKNSRVPLNTLQVGASFGIASLFSDSEQLPTNVYATRDTEILFIDKETLLEIIESSPTVSKNVITFLSERVSFLNKKIATFSSENVESKLGTYLYQKHEALGKAFEVNISHTAEEINAGRASLYRALSNLEAVGAITRTGKMITVQNKEKLVRK